MAEAEARIQGLTEQVRQGRNYADIAEDVARHAVERELPRRKNDREVVRAARSRLHQIAGAYIAGVDWQERTAQLVQAAAEGEEPLRAACLRLMAEHASTRERLGELEAYYAAVFAGLGPVQSVLDVGCGLNPLAIPWMALAANARYMAWDVYEGLAEMLNTYFPLVGVAGQALACDMTTASAGDSFDLVLMLKVLNNAEQLQSGSAKDMLTRINARHVVVSFPRKSLGGRDVGMSENYRRQLDELADGDDWIVKELPLKCELVFRLSRS